MKCPSVEPCLSYLLQYLTPVPRTLLTPESTTSYFNFHVWLPVYNIWHACCRFAWVTWHLQMHTLVICFPPATCVNFMLINSEGQNIPSHNAPLWMLIIFQLQGLEKQQMQETLSLNHLPKDTASKELQLWEVPPQEFHQPGRRLFYTGRKTRQTCHKPSYLGSSKCLVTALKTIHILAKGYISLPVSLFQWRLSQNFQEPPQGVMALLDTYHIPWHMLFSHSSRVGLFCDPHGL